MSPACLRWPFKPFTSIVMSTYGLCVEPVAWQIVTVWAVGLAAGVVVVVGLPVTAAVAVVVAVVVAVTGAGVAVTVPEGVAPTCEGQPPAGAGTMSPWARCAGRALALTVIRLYGLCSEPVRWQIVTFDSAVPVTDAVAVTVAVTVEVTVKVLV